MSSSNNGYNHSTAIVDDGSSEPVKDILDSGLDHPVTVPKNLYDDGAVVPSDIAGQYPCVVPKNATMTDAKNRRERYDE